MTELIYLPPLIWDKRAGAHYCRLGRLIVGIVREIESLRSGQRHVIHIANEPPTFCFTLDDARHVCEARVLELLQAPE